MGVKEALRPVGRVINTLRKPEYAIALMIVTGLASMTEGGMLLVREGHVVAGTLSFVAGVFGATEATIKNFPLWFPGQRR